MLRCLTVTLALLSVVLFGAVVFGHGARMMADTGAAAHAAVLPGTAAPHADAMPATADAGRAACSDARTCDQRDRAACAMACALAAGLAAAAEDATARPQAAARLALPAALPGFGHQPRLAERPPRNRLA